MPHNQEHVFWQLWDSWSRNLATQKCHSTTAISLKTTRKRKASFFPTPCFMFSCISSQSRIRGQKHSSCCLLPVTHHFKHFVLHPQNPKMFKKHSCACMKPILQDVLLKNTIELCEPIGPYVQFLLACAFLHPQAQHVSHAFRSCYRHTDFSRQPVPSFHARLIWLAARPRSGDRQLHLQELARPFVPVEQLLPTEWPRA